MGVLGSMILEPSAIVLAERRLEASDFFRPAHQTIFMACRGLAEGLDLVTLKHELESEGRLAACGGEDYLVQLAEFVPSVANIEFYAGIVKEKSERRRTVSDAKKLITLAEGEAGIEEVRAARSSLTEAFPGGVAVVPFGEVEHDSEDRGVPTFIPALNRMMATGGWPSEQVSVSSAYHKGGKSTFMLTDFIHAAELSEKVLYATFADLSAKQLKRRLIKALCGWKKRPVSGDLGRLYDNAIFTIDCWDAFVYDASAMEDGDDLESFCAWVRAEGRERPFSRIYVDYAQELTSRKVLPTDEYGTAAVCAKALAKLARQTGAAVIVGSQITDGSSAAGTRTKTKGSRRWEEIAGLVLRIQREGALATIQVPFSRFGICGPEVSVGCRWSPERLRFEAS
jgi:replicative DNA helicase